MYLLSTRFQQGCQNHLMGERIVFSTKVAGKLDSHIQKNDAEPLPHTI